MRRRATRYWLVSFDVPFIRSWQLCFSYICSWVSCTQILHLEAEVAAVDVTPWMSYLGCHTLDVISWMSHLAVFSSQLKEMTGAPLYIAVYYGTCGKSMRAECTSRLAAQSPIFRKYLCSFQEFSCSILTRIPRDDWYDASFSFLDFNFSLCFIKRSSKVSHWDSPKAVYTEIQKISHLLHFSRSINKSLSYLKCYLLSILHYFWF